ncbi:MAG: cobalt ECF transporter T component CbiQ [Anaerolineales bacterium]
MQQMLLDPYYPTASAVHELEPRLKLVCVLAYIVAATALPTAYWPGYIALAALAAVAIVGARMPLGLVLGRTAIALPFVGVVALSVPFTRGGAVLWSGSLLGLPLAITAEGQGLFLSILAKSWLSVLLVGVLVATTPMSRVLGALRALRVPAVLVTTIALMYRYLFVLVAEAGRLHVARESRSVGKGGSVGWRARVLGGMVGSLFIRSYERSERVYAAMLSRGFDGEVQSLDEQHWTARDTLLLAAWFALLLPIVLVGRIPV